MNNPVTADNNSTMISLESPPKIKFHWLIAILAFFIFGLIPESILTSSTSALKIFIQPGDLIFVALYYGMFVLFVRDLMVRRNLGWQALLLFGISFGFFNEGVVADTWYTTKFVGMSYLGHVNVAWAVNLTIFHIFFSVFLPITAFNALFPQMAQVPVLNKRFSYILLVVFFLYNGISAFNNTYRTETIIVFFLAFSMFFLALNLPVSHETRTTTKVPSIRALIWLGIAVYIEYMLTLYLVPAIDSYIFQQYIALIVNIAISVIQVIVWGNTIQQWRRSENWARSQSLAIITGVFLISTILTIVATLAKNVFEPFITIPALLLMAILLRRSLLRYN